MKKTKRIAQETIQKTLDKEWQAAIKSCFGMTHREALALVKPYGKNAETPVRGLTLGMVWALGGYGKFLAKKHRIKTQEDLHKAVQQMREARNAIPAATRKAFKMIASKLPRAGGPGRHSKLNPQEASKACDHISTFIRQKHTLKQALQMVSEMSPTLLGKKVGARTLQKAWDIRDKLTGE
jgi:hypothetical protein